MKWRGRVVVTNSIRRVGNSSVARRTITVAPGLSSVSQRFIGGVDERQVIDTVGRLEQHDLLVSVHARVGAVTTSAAADAHVARYEHLISELVTAGLADGAEVSLKIPEFGDGTKASWPDAVDRIRAVVGRAYDSGVRVTIDTLDEEQVAPTLDAVRDLRRTHPDVGACLQAYLTRTEHDVREFATPNSRIRLVKGGFRSGNDSAFVNPRDVEAAYVRCLRGLFEGDGYPMVATQALAFARQYQRGVGDYELQMLHGIQPVLQQRLAQGGRSVRVFLPYGPEWYSWVVNRVAEKPSSMLLAARALLPQR